MAQLTIQVNGRPYTVGCEDGQEAHLLEISRLFLMGALLLADELSDLKLRLAHAQGELSRLQNEQNREANRIEIAAIRAIDAVAERIEKLAAD